MSYQGIGCLHNRENISQTAMSTITFNPLHIFADIWRHRDHRVFTALKQHSFDSGKANPLALLAFSSRFRRSTGNSRT